VLESAFFSEFYQLRLLKRRCKLSDGRPR